MQNESRVTRESNAAFDAFWVGGGEGNGEIDAK